MDAKPFPSNKMAAARTSTEPIYCDGCSREATAEHLRCRIARLESASRFRPIRIGTLFLMPEPPEAMEDFFYFPDGPAKDPEVRAFYGDLLESSGIAQNGTETRQDTLRGFQERGCFLTGCVECPTGFLGGENFDALLGRLLTTLVRRIRFSYRPKAIILISDRLKSVAQPLREAGFQALLPERIHGPIPLPKSADNARRAEFRAKIASLLARSDAEAHS